jgi:hypothetical protein
VPLTFNWPAAPGESFLVPRLLSPEEWPQAPAVVRALIDLTAQGLPTPLTLR